MFNLFCEKYLKDWSKHTISVGKQKMWGQEVNAEKPEVEAEEKP